MKNILFGKMIISTSAEMAHGWIRCLSNGKIYCFKPNVGSAGFYSGEKVCFAANSGNTAKDVRKVYINKHGIEFLPKYNVSHMHQVSDEHFSALIDNIASTDQSFIELEHRFPYAIGFTDCVSTNCDDRVVYAIRKGRKGHSRLVLNRDPEECDTVFGVFKRDGRRYIIITTYVGKKNALEPWDQRATEADMSFWQEHALIYNSFDIISGSSCSVCPWVLNLPSVSKHLIKNNTNQTIRHGNY